MQERAPIRLVAILALALAAGLAPAARAQSADEGAPPSLAPWSWDTTPAHLRIATALREARRASPGEGAELLQRIVQAGRDAIPAQLDILMRGRVPETAPDDGAQILSEVQRNLLLSALAKMPLQAVRAEIDARLLRTPDDSRARLGAIYALGVVGEAQVITRLLELTPRAAEGQDLPLPTSSREALSSAVATLLRRDPQAWPVLAEGLRTADLRAGSALLDALRPTRDPRSLKVLFETARANPKLAWKAVSLVPICGSSLKAETDQEFLEWMRDQIQTAPPAFVRTLLMAVGTLDDGEWIPTLIERLEDEDGGIRDGALAALQRISGLGFASDPAAWRAWYTGESRWQTERRPKLLAQLNSADAPKVFSAVREYSEHRTRRAEMAEELSVAFEHGNSEVRGLVISVLERLGSPAACGALLRMTGDGDAKLAEAAWQALHTISGIELSRDPEQLREMFGRT